MRKNEQVTQADVADAVRLLNEGHSPDVVQAQLVEGGLSAEEAASVVGNLLLQAVYADAVDLLNQGLPPQQVKQQLVAKGLEKRMAADVVDDILAQNRLAAEAGPESTRAVVQKLLGVAIFVVGVVLFIGNVTGGFPTFPFAGFLVMNLGGLLWGASDC